MVKEGPRTHNSPSLDRTDPKLGYILGNVRVLSWRANYLKGDATVQEIRKLLAWMEKDLSPDKSPE